MDKSKDEVLEDLQLSIRRLTVEAGNLDGDTVLVAAGGDINALLARVACDAFTIRGIMGELPKAGFLKMLALLEGKNGDYKADNLTKMLYKRPLDALKRKEVQLRCIKDAMAASVRYLLICTAARMVSLRGRA